MPDSTLTTRSQKLEIDQVQQIDVTDIVAEGGHYVREIRIYGSPDGTSAPPVATLRVTADTQAEIELKTPNLTF